LEGESCTECRKRSFFHQTSFLIIFSITLRENWNSNIKRHSQQGTPTLALTIALTLTLALALTLALTLSLTLSLSLTLTLTLTPTLTPTPTPTPTQMKY